MISLSLAMMYDLARVSKYIGHDRDYIDRAKWAFAEAEKAVNTLPVDHGYRPLFVEACAVFHPPTALVDL